MQELSKVEKNSPHYYGDHIIQDISPKKLFELMLNEEYVLMDIRDERSYFYAHIPGAIHVPINDFHKSENQTIFNSNQQVIIYCYVGVSSLRAIETIVDMGYSSEIFFHLKGGIARWNTEGFIVVNTPAEIKLDV